jgi:hypothetical protein
LCIACAENYYILKYNAAVVDECLATGRVPDEGIEEAFEVLHDIQDRYGYFI